MSSSSPTSFTAMLIELSFPRRTTLGLTILPFEDRMPSLRRLVTSSMAAFDGAQMRILSLGVTSSVGRDAPRPAWILVSGAGRSEMNLPTRPQIVLVFPVPGGLGEKREETGDV
jgi:hypothetical protein